MIAECDRKLAGYVPRWTRAQARPRLSRGSPRPKQKKAGYLAVRRPNPIRRRRMSEAEIKAIVDRLADLVRVLADADPNDKSEIFRQLGLGLTYHQGRGLMKVQVTPAECWFLESVRGPTLSSPTVSVMTRSYEVGARHLASLAQLDHGQ